MLAAILLSLLFPFVIISTGCLIKNKKRKIINREEKKTEETRKCCWLSEVENSFLPWRPQQFPQALAHFQLPVNLHSHLNINFKLSKDTSQRLPNRNLFGG